jgi:hypothetical protein
VPRTSRLQIRGVDQGQRQIVARAPGQERCQQALVDLAQSAGPGALPKLVPLPDIRHCLAIGQVGEATPSPLLAQQAHQVVEGMDWRQHAQQMEPIQLRRTQLPASAPTAMARDQIVDEGVWDIRREQRQKLGGAGGRQVRIHSALGLPQRNRCVHCFRDYTFSMQNGLQDGRLRRIP